MRTSPAHLARALVGLAAAQAAAAELRHKAAGASAGGDRWLHQVRGEGLDWQADREHGALADLRVNLDRSTVRLNELLGDAEAQTSAPVAAADVVVPWRRAKKRQTLGGSAAVSMGTARNAGSPWWNSSNISPILSRPMPMPVSLTWTIAHCSNWLNWAEILTVPCEHYRRDKEESPGRLAIGRASSPCE